jgi:predicted deacylase
MSSPSIPSTAFTTIDLDKPGKQVGFVMIPHSPHGDAWGVTRLPIAVIANGKGPTVILEGGNHGDEYEGPIIISELARELDPAAINGRLILMPAVNVHAVMGGQRTSPVDGLNLNRTFPGDPRGTITEQISAFMAQEIFPRGNAFVDLHSGGTSLDIIASAVIEPAEDKALLRKNIEAAKAFGAPMTVVIANMGDPRTATAAAVRAGLVTMGTEMAGGGTVSPEAIGICRRGVRNVLAHFGVLPPEAVESPADKSQVLELPGSRAYVFAPIEGIFEPFHEKGRVVSAGEPAGRVHVTWDLTRAPEVVHYPADGILYGRRQPGRVTPGNCCLVVASPYNAEL